jgi:phosphoglycerate kinase
MKLRSIRDAELKGRRVLLRVDFNVPLDDGRVADSTRISAAMPTLVHLLEQGAHPILCSHLGRPKGVDDRLRLDPVAAALESLLNAHLPQSGNYPAHVRKLSDCVGPDVEQYARSMQPGDVILLENLRFHPGEEANDPAFAAQLAALAEVYVNDAFGTVHRAHASTEGVARLLPGYAGLLVEKEVEALSRVASGGEQPLVIVMGGAKISDKIEVLDNLLPKAAAVLIGGAMANTFLGAAGFTIGASRVEPDQYATATRLQQLADDSGVMLLLPVDFTVTDDINDPLRIDTKLAHDIGPGDIIVDIGPKTAEQYGHAISDARTVFWNGPMGVFEREEFSCGTLAIAAALADARDSAYTVVGGGESVEAVNKGGFASRIHHISTGGGASLEFIGGALLPGLAVLEEQ